MRHLLFCAVGLVCAPMMAFADGNPSDNPITWKSDASASHSSGNNDGHGFAGDVDGIGGWRRLNNTGYWSPVEHQPAFGAQADLGWNPIPVRGELAIQTSSRKAELLYPNGADTGVSFTATLVDFAFGARVQPVSGWFRPYAGIGMILVDTDGKAEASGASNDASDSSVGYYAHAGLGFVVARHVHFGLDYRIVRGTHDDLNGAVGDSNNDQASLFVGYTWK